MEEIDLLEMSEPERRSRILQSTRSRRLTITVAAMAIALSGGAWWFDQSHREAESKRLAQCVMGAEQVARGAEARVDFMRSYIAPVLGRNLATSTRNGLYVLVREQASRGLPAVEKSQQSCQRIGIDGWHGDLRAAQTDYLTYLGARITVLRIVSADGGVTVASNEGVVVRKERASESLRRVGITLSAL